MAITPTENETFYREVDEELRKDQLSEWFRKYGWFVIGGVVLLLVAIGGFIFWQNQREARAERHGEALIEALEQIEAGQTEGVDERLGELIDNGAPGYRAAALMTRANLALEAGNEEAAAAAFRQMAEDGKLAEPYRNLALIRQTALEYDRIEPAEVIRRLGAMAQAGNAWLGSAGEMVAIAHMRQNQPDQAAPIFAAIARDETVPQSIRSRAVQMAGALGVDAVQDAPGAEGDGNGVAEVNSQ